ncbi:hypothetical protein BRC62_02960 [Halobacteriales archaeon QH_10_67_13]|nr:MAG: hypothetical protein BRC62_02960 [Halobacteriales archaeon QH_10_67_13]
MVGLKYPAVESPSMVWVPSTATGGILLGAALAAAVAVGSWRQRPDPMAIPLAALMVASLAWAIPYAVSLEIGDLGQASMWYRLRYPGAVLLPPAYLIVAIAYAGYEEWLTKRVFAGLAAVPVTTVLLAWAGGVTDLFWVSASFESVGTATVLRPSFGPWYPIQIAYLYLLIAVAFVLLIQTAVRAGRVRKRRVLLFLFGGIVPIAFNVPFRLGLGPVPAVDLTPATAAVSGFIFWVALYRDDLRNLPPVAYQNVPALLGDAVLVFDPADRLIEANDQAKTLFEEIEAGVTATELFGDAPDSLDGTVVSPARGEYELRSSSVTDWRDNRVGTVVVLRDVTELKANEQRLSVANRILRHNLRNELTIILGEVDRLADQADNDEAFERIEAAATRLSRLSEKARHIRSPAVSTDAPVVAVDLSTVAESVLARHRARAPAAELSLEAPEGAFVSVPGREAVETILDNLLENAIEHHDRSQPSVAVTVDPGDPVTLRVADDGPGIPPAEREPLAQGEESQLEHASGLGLWLVRWLVEAADGTLAFEDREPRGTVVTVRLPPAETPEPERSESRAAPVGPRAER